jgi:hypothetical protein
VRIIYHCWGGSHSSVVCASIHLGTLPCDRVPTTAEYMAVARFERQTNRDHGRLFLMGTDSDGNEVYILGRRSSGRITDHILPGTARAFGLPDCEVATFDTIVSVNLAMRIGGLLSRGLGVVAVGRPLVIAGCKLAHRAFCRDVAAFRERLRANGCDSVRRSEQGATELPEVIYYHCHGGAHSSVTAAAIHLGALPTDRRPAPEEVAGIPYYDRTTNEEIGTPFYCGTDDSGRHVHIVGMIRSAKIVCLSVRSLLDVLAIPQDRLTFVDCLPLVSLWTRIGGFLSRQLGLVALGRPLTIRGILLNYDRFVATVASTKARLTQNDGR